MFFSWFFLGNLYTRIKENEIYTKVFVSDCHGY